MPQPEEELSHHHNPGEPHESSPLPPELATWLAGEPLACLFQETDQGTVLLLKLPGADIAGIRTPVPIGLQHALHDHPAAPVIRTVLTIHDQPATPLALETFTNVADPQQRAEFAALAEQEQLALLFFDEAVRHRRTIQMALRDPDTLRGLLQRAEALLAAIPPDQVDFDAAKRDVLEGTRL
jgi:hypothetical protein